MYDPTTKRLLDLNEILRKERRFYNSLIRYKQTQEVIDSSNKRIIKIMDEINAVSSGKLTPEGE